MTEKTDREFVDNARILASCFRIILDANTLTGTAKGELLQEPSKKDILEILDGIILIAQRAIDPPPTCEPLLNPGKHCKFLEKEIDRLLAEADKKRGTSETA